MLEARVVTVVGRIGKQSGADPLPPGYSEERGLTFEEAGRILGLKPKKVKALPLKRVRYGHRTVRLLLSDVVAYMRSRAL
jgi:hypothetical protein